jgi:hypothetical protein
MTSNDIRPPKYIAHDRAWQTLIEFTLSRDCGSASLTADRVAGVVQTLNWSDAPLERLKYALTQAIHNTMECSRLYGSEAPLFIRVLIPEDGETTAEAGQASDEPAQRQVSERAAQQISGSASRNWGFFLVQKQGDDPQAVAGESHHVIELFLYQESHL